MKGEADNTSYGKRDLDPFIEWARLRKGPEFVRLHEAPKSVKSLNTVENPTYTLRILPRTTAEIIKMNPLDALRSYIREEGRTIELEQLNASLPEHQKDNDNIPVIDSKKLKVVQELIVGVYSDEEIEMEILSLVLPLLGKIRAKSFARWAGRSFSVVELKAA